MQLLTWNVAGRVANLDRQAAAVDRFESDLVCLQEVRPSTLPRWRTACERMGLGHVIDSAELRGGRQLFCLTASRWELTALPAVPGPYPERVLSVVAETPSGQLELHNAHIPPAMRNGMVKAETLEALYGRLARPCTRHRVLCGDFNLPQFETTEGEIITFAADHSEQIERWDAAERCLLEGLREWDLRDCFRQLNGWERRDVSWVFHTRAARKAAHRLDHILASAEMRVRACDYHHEWREAGLSDHSGMYAVFDPVTLT